MNHLIENLLEKQALNPDTVITTCRMLKDQLGNISKQQEHFVFVDAIKSRAGYKLRVKNIVGNDQIIVMAEDVTALDGMDLTRYVDVYDINPDGSDKKVGKKRGRKPKSQL